MDGMAMFQQGHKRDILRAGVISIFDLSIPHLQPTRAADPGGIRSAGRPSAAHQASIGIPQGSRSD
jgi:hypothetical protein